MADPNAMPRKPRFAPPKGAWDAHCHVWGKSERWPNHEGDRLMALHDHLGFDRAVIVQADKAARAITVKAMAESGGRYRGVALVDEGESEADLATLHALGFRGVRFTFVSHLGGAPDLLVVRRVLERVKPLGWHVTFLVDAPDLLINQDLLRAITIPVVFDHMLRVDASAGVGQAGFRALLDFVQRPNGWVKVSGCDRCSATGAPFHDAVPLAQALIAAAPDRVIWGTDWPHPNNRHNPDTGDLVDLLPMIAPDAATRQKILVDNPARLYGL